MQYLSHDYNVDTYYYSNRCMSKINPSATGYAISQKCIKKISELIRTTSAKQFL